MSKFAKIMMEREAEVMKTPLKHSKVGQKSSKGLIHFGANDYNRELA